MNLGWRIGEIEEEEADKPKSEVSDEDEEGSR